MKSHQELKIIIIIWQVLYKQKKANIGDILNCFFLLCCWEFDYRKNSRGISTIVCWLFGMWYGRRRKRWLDWSCGLIFFWGNCKSRAFELWLPPSISITIRVCFKKIIKSSDSLSDRSKLTVWNGVRTPIERQRTIGAHGDGEPLKTRTKQCISNSKKKEHSSTYARLKSGQLSDDE